mmetsp:Transcript_52078/g.122262  ORF Transcript_52078/g.122262 Transcript_52078/m.122262 type:complete len:359 (+) Transcript_52078:559-1635(+)
MVRVAGNHQVYTVLLRDPLPELHAPQRRKVGDGNLPVRLQHGVFKLDRQPAALRLPNFHEPELAGARAVRASHRTSLQLLVMAGAANVVRRIRFWIEGVVDVGIQKKVVDDEALLDPGPSARIPVVYRSELVEESRLKPPVRRTWSSPGVGDHLVPSRKIVPASPVVVAKYSKPLQVIQGPVVHLLKDIRPLWAPIEGIHVLTTFAVDATPVEVVTNIDDVADSIIVCVLHHGLCHLLLRQVVDSVHKLSVVCLELHGPMICGCSPDSTIQHPAPVADDVDRMRPLVIFGEVEASGSDVADAIVIQRVLGLLWRAPPGWAAHLRPIASVRLCCESRHQGYCDETSCTPHHGFAGQRRL